MQLVEIRGKIWELSILQSESYSESDRDPTTLAEKNVQAIRNLGWHKGIVRTIANHGVKSKALAVIETEVRGLPQQMIYDIYHNSKGFYCNVQGQRVFLETLLADQQGD